MIKKKNYISRDIDKTFSGKRLDLVLADTFSEFSRSKLKKWLESNLVSVNEKVVNKPSFKVTFPAKLELIIPDENLTEDLAERLDLKIIKSTKEYIIISKEAGMVVHPGAGNKSGTLLNALLYEYPELKKLPRAGIVHRLDKDTSGIMVVARNESSYLHLVSQLKEREVNRHYLAIVVGEPLSGSTINEPIGRHPKQRTKQAVTDTGKEAITNFKVQEKLGGYTLLNVSLETGRTHQIRVHLAYINFPILGDSIYGARRKFAAGTSETAKKEILKFPRQALHAEKLEFIHPTSGKKVNYSSKIPKDLEELFEFLRSPDE